MLPHTKLICTLGPRTSSVKSIVKLAQHGMSIARINLSHGTREQHRETIMNIREAQKSVHHHIAIALDTRGPECRIILKEDMHVSLHKQIRFVLKDEYEKSDLHDSIVGLNLLELPPLKVNSRILLDDMKLKMVVTEVDSTHFIAISHGDHLLSSSKRVSFPGTPLRLPFLQKPDISDIKFGEGEGVDAIFLSFVQTAEDVLEVKRLLTDSSIQLIAKIESKAGISNLHEILKVCDGIMVARGDLCADVGVSRMFSAQKQLTDAIHSAVSSCYSKPVIMATEMLQSMVARDTPTRAEISDVGNAVCDGCAAVMLSAETASGQHPYKSVRVLKKVCADAERYIMLKGRYKFKVTKIETMDRKVIRRNMLVRGVYCCLFRK